MRSEGISTTCSYPRKRSLRRALSALAKGQWLALAALLGLPAAANAVPVEGYVNDVNFLEFTIDHHFSALRMTELAAGTNVVGPTSGFAGSPVTYPPTPAKGTDPVVLDISTMANSNQRGEILLSQYELQNHYGVSNFPPTVLPSGQAMIDQLTQVAPGDPFNILFLQLFSQHHASLMGPAEECAASSPQPDIRNMCQTMVKSQMAQIKEMQTELKNVYGISPVPIPGSAGLLATGLIWLGYATRKRAAAPARA